MGVGALKFFSKKRMVQTPQDDRVRVRQALVLTPHKWSPDRHLVIHLESRGENFIKHFNAYSWSGGQVQSRSDGDHQMATFLKDPAALAAYFGDSMTRYGRTQVLSVTSSHGFSSLFDRVSPRELAAIDQTKRQEEMNDTLALGRFLEEWLERQGNFAGGSKETRLLYQYFYGARLTPGFFGSFKFILKKLTLLYEKELERRNFDLVLTLTDALAFGYGRVEAYLSKGDYSPRTYLNQQDFPFDSLGRLPEFADGAYPSLRTAQYLSRKGLRLLKRIERECPDPKVALVFRGSLMKSADIFDERHNRFSEYQLLVSYIIFGDSGLQTRNSSGRKLDLAPLELRENFDSGTTAVATLPKSGKDYYAQWLTDIRGANPAIAHHAFSLARALGQKFNWSDESLFSMASSSNPAVHDELAKLVSETPERLLKLAPKDQVRYLRLFSGAKLDEVLTKLPSGWRGSQLVAEWVSFATTAHITDTDLYITQHLIREYPWAIDANRHFGLFLNLARHSKLDSIENWGEYVGLKAWSGHSLWRLDAASTLRYLGAGEDQGFFDVSAPPLIEKLTELFASELVWFLQRRPATSTEILLGLVDSGSEKLFDLALAVLISPELPQGVLDEVASIPNSPDFSMALFRSFVDQQNEAGLLHQLTRLAEERQHVFWRRNGSGVEILLREWPGFAAFLWKHLGQLPKFVTDTFLAYEWLPDKFRAHIRPSQIAKMNEFQAEALARLISVDPKCLSSDSLLRAILVAPNATLNELGVRYVTGLARLDEFWLLMLESNLPVSSKAAYDHLKSKLGQPDFIDKLLMALDSNNSAARSSALGLLKEIDNPELVADIIQNLAENRNPDTWSVIAEHISLIRDGARLQHFTKLVFLSRLQARRQKELIKQRIQELTEDVHEAVEKDVLIRLSLSSVIQDREWALKQIALGNVDIDAVVVERTWSGGPNV